MKYVLIISLFLLVSCGNSAMSESKKEYIKTVLLIHNINTHIRFVEDSLREGEKFQTSLIGLKFSKDSVEAFSKVHGKVFANEWNDPYDIKKDQFLTFEKYIDYCKAHNLDEKSYFEFLD